MAQDNPDGEQLTKFHEDKPIDPWEHRSVGMKCKTCMWHVNFRCRIHAPSMNGYPAVYPDDWCGDHKMDKVTMGGK